MNRRVAIAVVAAVAAGVVVSSSSAHLVARPAGPGLEARAKSQRVNVAHARFVCRRGGGEHRRWSCRAVRWLERELERTERVLEARRVAAIAEALSRVGDFAVAVRQVERWFGPQPWLWSCPRSEGGFGAFVMNRQGSDAGGWLQFMPGTFYGVIDSAIREARRRGMPVPSNARSWRSPLGQALAGVEMLRQGRRGEFEGATC